MDKIQVFIKRNFIWIILLICLVGFCFLAKEVYNKEIMKVDIIGYKIVSTLLMSDFATLMSKIITNLGGVMWLILLSAILFLVIKNKKIGLAIAGNSLIATVLNLLLKNILQRPRPIEYRLIDESGYSFPSGHSMVSMAFYGFIIYLIYKYVKNKYVKYTLITLLSILILLIGISRIYLGVHYTSDVLAGFLISISYLIIYIKVINKFVNSNSKHNCKNG